MSNIIEPNKAILIQPQHCYGATVNYLQDLNIFPPKLGFLPDHLCNGSNAMTSTKCPMILSSPRALLVREVQFLALAKVEATLLMI